MAGHTGRALVWAVFALASFCPSYPPALPPEASLQFRFVFNSQLISRSKKTEMPCIQDTPGSPLLTLYVGFRQGTALGCSVKPDWGGDRLRTPLCVTGPDIPLAGVEAENREAASAPSSGA